MNKLDNFEELIKGSLENYQAPANPNAWADMNQRLDQMGGRAPGNKVFKLRGHLDAARAAGIGHIASFGGAWSNHLHALAATGAELGLQTTGIIRGGEHTTAMLADAQRWGMSLMPVTRAEYRRRDEPEYLRQLQQRLGPGCLLVPEGGGGVAGLRGCLDIADLINRLDRQWSRVVLAVGTGTTLAGVVAGLDCAREVVGVSALKGADGLEADVDALLQASGRSARCAWRIDHRFHCGGFARSNSALQSLVLALQWERELLLEPVYTGKALYAVHSLLASGEWSSAEPVLVIHTGGLQGRRGYPWLRP